MGRNNLERDFCVDFIEFLYLSEEFFLIRKLNTIVETFVPTLKQKMEEAGLPLSEYYEPVLSKLEELFELYGIYFTT
uniref:Uncharacterized protein n=1 Tax=Acrobeloides nanus TaxID=290746 RepID=A0A914CXG1_9BILA